VVSSRAAGGRRASLRRLPPVVLLLLAALAVAVGSASAARSGVAAPAPAAFVPAPAVAGHRPSGIVDGTVPGNPARVDLPHASARTAAIERPPLDAVLPGVALAVALLVLVARRGEEQRRRGLALPSGWGRGPPESAV